jgi:ABC-2 type transport system ATP-binding protein
MVNRPDPDGVTVDVAGLSRRFAARQVVDDVSFTVQPGRVTGFLGPNGAGKTTTLRMLLGLLEPTTGTATIGGRPYRDLPSPTTTVGASLEGNAHARGRRGVDHLRSFAPPAHASRARVDELLETVGLTEHARRPVGSYSLGMQQRLALATALLGDPDVLVLDEPANGLDPMGVYWLRTFLRDFAASGRTVLLSSHMLAEMELIADDVVLIDQGRTVYVGTLQDLLGEERTVVTPFGPDAHAALADVLRDRGVVHLGEVQGNRLLVDAPAPTVQAWTTALLQERPSLTGTFSVERMGLEAAFLARIAQHEETAR